MPPLTDAPNISGGGAPSGVVIPPRYIFFISNGRQAYNAVAFIKRQAWENVAIPIFIVLYDREGKEKNNIIREASNAGIQLESVKLPRGAPYFSFRKSNIISKIYKNIIIKYSPERIYVFNYNTHYGILLSEAERRRIPAYFIEEGMSSYKVSRQFSPPRSYMKIIDKDIIADSLIGDIFFRRPALYIWRNFLCSENFFIAAKREINFFGRVIFGFFDNERTLQYFRRLIRFQRNYYNFHEYVPMFAEVHGIDISRLMKLINAESFYYFNYLAETLPDMKEEYQKLLSTIEITEDTVLFVDQSYDVDKAAIIKSVISWLIGRCIKFDILYVKPHPKSHFKEAHIEAMRRNHPGVDIRIFPYDLPAEYVPALSKCRTVVGIASTSLLYSKLLRSDIRTVALYERILSEASMDSRVAEVIREHGNLIKDAGVEIAT